MANWITGIVDMLNQRYSLEDYSIMMSVSSALARKNATLIIIPIPKFGTNMLAFTHSRVKSSTASIRILFRSFTIKWNVKSFMICSLIVC